MVEKMTKDQLVTGFKMLSSRERREFIDMIQNLQGNMNANLPPGTKVKFKNRDGVYIEGLFVRMRQRYAEIKSDQGKHGEPRPTVWTVSPSMLEVVEIVGV